MHEDEFQKDVVGPGYGSRGAWACDNKARYWAPALAGRSCSGSHAMIPQRYETTTGRDARRQVSRPVINDPTFCQPYTVRGDELVASKAGGANSEILRW